MQSIHQKKVQHLYWRAGFGLHPKQWKKRQNESTHQLASNLINKAKSYTPLKTSFSYSEDQVKGLSKLEKVNLRKMTQKEIGTLNLRWLLRMGKSDNPLLERMSLFWHGHFACEIKRPDYGVQYLNVLRQHGLGKLKDLVLGIAQTPAMIRYLNNQQNRKRQPNENFARELLELFTIGRGNYTEQDIKEAARAFTGWTSNQQGFLFREQWHDSGQKTFLGNSGDFGGEEIIEIVLNQRETAQFITRKIYRYFVNEQINESRVNQLAEEFYNSDYAIDKLMLNIFTSDWFYEEENIGNKIKSPIELIAGLNNLLTAKYDNAQPLFSIQKALGQTLLKPPNVAGWKGGRAWIDNATLLLRLNTPMQFLTQAEVNINIKEAFEATATVQRLKNVRMSCDLDTLESAIGTISTPDDITRLASYIIQPTVGNNADLLASELKKVPKEELFKYTLIGLMSLPEYQLC